MAAFLALLAFAVLLASVSAVITALSESAILGVVRSFFIVFAYTLIFGIIPALFIGAPSYAWLWHKGYASWITATCLGVALCAPFFLVGKEFGVWAIAGGSAVAIATHAVCRVGANYSFKPRPLRGSA